MVDIREVNYSIMNGSFTNEELESVIAAVKFRRSQLTREAKRSFRVGTSVKFYNSRRAQHMNGTVEKVAIKYITVRTTQGLWKVPAAMLEAA